MLWLLGQLGNIPLDILRRGVVVVKDGGYLVGDDVDHLADADVEREDAVQDDEDEHVQLTEHKLANSQARPTVLLRAES